MQLVKPASIQNWMIFDRIFWFPGTADSLMQKTPQDRMDALATYLADHITVFEKPFEKGFSETLL